MRVSLNRARCTCGYEWIAIVIEPVHDTLECPSCRAPRGTTFAHVRDYGTVADAEIAAVKMQADGRGSTTHAAPTKPRGSGGATRH